MDEHSLLVRVPPVGETSAQKFMIPSLCPDKAVLDRRAWISYLDILVSVGALDGDGDDAEI